MEQPYVFLTFMPHVKCTHWRSPRDLTLELDVNDTDLDGKRRGRRKGERKLTADFLRNRKINARNSGKP